MVWAGGVEPPEARLISGAVLGRGADLIIGDDAMSPGAVLSEAVRLREINFWNVAHRTRLNNKRTGAIIQVAQRLHQEDLIGHVMGQEEWEHLKIPAISILPVNYQIGPSPNDVYSRAADEVLLPDREPMAVLDETRAAIGSVNFSAQYLQDPIPPGGTIIERDWRRYYNEGELNEILSQRDYMVASWDLASTLEEHNAFSVGTVWVASGRDFYLLAIVRKRCKFTELRGQVLELSRAWKPDNTVIEATELGRAMAEAFRESGELLVKLQVPRLDKSARLGARPLV